MFSLILPSSFMAIFTGFYFALRQRGCPEPRRIAFISAHLTWALLLTGITEGLGFINRLTPAWTGAAWGIVLAASVTIAFLAFRKPGLPPGKVSFDLVSLDALLFFILAGLFITITLIGINRWFVYDGQVYHLPRVFYWMQNHNLNHYPTWIPLQLFAAPGSQFFILHHMLLGGNDQLIHLINGTHLAGILIAVSLIAKRLGGNTRAQIMAALFCLTAPVIIQEATSTDTDIAAALWLAYFVYFLLHWRQSPGIPSLAALGIALGLAGLAKTTAFLFAAPFVVWFIWELLASRPKSAFAALLIVIGLTIGIHFPHAKRNMDLFGNPISSREFFDRHRNTLISPALLVSNAVRNAGLTLTTSIPALDRTLDTGIRKIHGFLHTREDDLRKNTDEECPDLYSSADEYKQAWPVFSVLGLLCWLGFVPLFLLKKNKDHFYYGTALTAAFLGFCFFHKFVPDNRRFMVPLLILWTPWVAAFLSEKGVRWLRSKTFTGLLLVALMGGAAPKLISNIRQINPRLNRLDPMESFFRKRHIPLTPYQAASDFIRSRKLTQIGLLLPSFRPEYRFLAVLRKTLPYPFRVEHIGVKNVSQTLSRPQLFQPEVIVLLSAPRDGLPEDTYTYRGIPYKKSFQYPQIILYSPYGQESD